MDREIRFKAWDERQRVMHNDFQFIKSGEGGNDWIVFTSDKQTLQSKPHPLENPYFQQQLKIMQFTGLLDKDGREIYEADILHTDYEIILEDESRTPATAVVEMFRGAFIARWKQPCYDGDEGNYALFTDDEPICFVVAGNIYENPELLSKEGV